MIVLNRARGFPIVNSDRWAPSPPHLIWPLVRQRLLKFEIYRRTGNVCESSLCNLNIVSRKCKAHQESFRYLDRPNFKLESHSLESIILDHRSDQKQQ